MSAASSGTLNTEKTNPAFELPPLPNSVNPTSDATPATTYSILRSLKLVGVDENLLAIVGYIRTSKGRMKIYVFRKGTLDQMKPLFGKARDRHTSIAKHSP